jgi:activator of HSP90 ATPase
MLTGVYVTNASYEGSVTRGINVRICHVREASTAATLNSALSATAAVTRSSSARSGEREGEKII